MTETNLKILIVDDDPMIQELLNVNLKTLGYEMFIAYDGKKALEIIMQEKPDLILLDVMVPEIDGWELCKIVKDDQELGKTKILMLTARDKDRDIMIGKFIFKADEYMTKPFEINNLLSAVDKLLHEKK